MELSRVDSPSVSNPEILLADYQTLRKSSEALCQPLAIEEYGIQSMPDVSPPKWHLAHTTWFFENFLLLPYLPSYTAFHPKFGYLFNSYYQTVGQFYPRTARGLLARPTVEEVYQYRHYIDAAMAQLMQSSDERIWSEINSRVILGINHEQQHQELLLTDIKYNFSINPLRPAYGTMAPCNEQSAPQLRWLDFPAGMSGMGHHDSGFAFDNETPHHRVYLQEHKLASRLVTNGEYLEFMEAGGYAKPEYWLSDGWRTVQEKNWSAPLYWEKINNEWWSMTLHGMRPLNLHQPVCHVSFYEADAFARWAGLRLPSEAEWENAVRDEAIKGNFQESGQLHPIPAGNASHQYFGDVWEWTQSAYAPYPGYKPLDGSLGEYNGKFMCNQLVLRGGSCVTSLSHIRHTYRNFFYPADRWQFTGFRLAQ